MSAAGPTYLRRFREPTRLVPQIAHPDGQTRWSTHYRSEIPVEVSKVRSENKRGFGFHPFCVFADHGSCGTGEALAMLLRPGDVGANTADDLKPTAPGSI